MTAITITQHVLSTAAAFFEDRGTFGCEGTAMIATTPTGLADRLVVPHQQANPTPRCWVEVTRQGKLELACALGPDDRYVARIHSHPGEAFHSETDDRNPALTHDGALSIVVPYFGLGLRRGLAACAVYVLRSGIWNGLPPGPQRDALVRVTV